MTRQEKLHELAAAARQLISDSISGLNEITEEQTIITAAENWERFVDATDTFWAGEEDK